MTLEMVETDKERRYELVFTNKELVVKLNPAVLVRVAQQMKIDKISSKLMGLSLLAKELEDQTLAIAGTNTN